MRQLSVAERARKMKEEASLDKKIEIAKDLLIHTDIVKSGTALCQFENDKWHEENNYFKKFLEYKDIESKIFKVDCDVSILCIVMYTLLNDKLSLKQIANQEENKEQYEIRIAGGRFRGDTLTSALLLVKLYLGCLWGKIDSDEELKQIRKYKDFYELFPYLSSWKIPAAPVGKWNTYCSRHSDIIWKVMDEEAKEFLKSCHMFGNYMCIPGNAYQGQSFNTLRSNYGKWDTVDTLLAKIYGYYQYADSSYLESIFKTTQSEIKNALTEETMKWLAGFENWQDFVDTNALQPFLDETSLIPISLKTGNIIKTDEIKTYDPIPETYDKFLKFFSEVSKRIVLRNECIFEKLTSEKNGYDKQ